VINKGLYALLFLLAACSGDSALSPCDIRDSTCRLDVFLAVQDVRGSLWDPWIEPPPMDVISEAEYRAQVIAERERARQQTGIDYFTEALKLLRMIDPAETPSDETDFMVESVAAYYDANAHHVTIIDRGEGEDQAEDVGTLAHELVHAAQDRDVGFGRLYRDVVSSDNALAMSALLEGEAVLYQYLIDAKQRDVPKTLIDWRIIDGWALDVRTRVFKHVSPYRLASTELLYPLGGAYNASAYKVGGPLELRRTYDPPPLSASRFIAGRGSLDDVAPPPWTCGLIDPPPEHEFVLGDELGALALYSFATRIAFAEPAAWERARSWTGDRFYVYRKPDDAGALAVVWLVRFTDNQGAIALHNMLKAVAWPQPLEAIVRGDTLHLFATRGPMDMPYAGFMQCNPL
jgi:hypothetical protein